MKIVGHQKQKNLLNRFVISKNIPHALLFSGPSMVGKKSLAIEFVKALNCEQGNRACGSCASCKQIHLGTHPDVYTVYPENGEIRINKIEEVIKMVSFKSSFSKYKAVIIDDAHLMNIQTQNSILKTLEEPLGDTVIILVTEYPFLLLPTITSRTFQIRFSFVSDNDMSSILKENKDLKLISSGRPGLVVNYVNNPEKIKEEQKRRKDFFDIINSSIPFRFTKIKEISKDENITELLGSWINYLREEMVKKINQEKDTSKLLGVIEEVEDVILLSMRTNTNLQLALEKIIIKL